MASTRMLTFIGTAVLAGNIAIAQQLGIPASEKILRDWNITIFPDGEGLPAGSGSVADGEILYKRLCVSCHGPVGQGALAEELAGGEGTLTDTYPDKTIGLYWPYATTLYDVISRSMPLLAPGSLSANENYALTAYLLFLNNILPAESSLDHISLPLISMPNRDGFFAIDAD